MEYVSKPLVSPNSNEDQLTLLDAAPQGHGGPKPPTIAPQNLSLTLPKGSSKTMQLVIANPNTKSFLAPDTEVTWKAVTGGESWLKLSKYSGTLQPSGQSGHQVTIHVTIEASSLQRGKEYKPTITFTASSTTWGESTTATVATVNVSIS